MARSHSYCAMVTYLSVKGSFILVGTCTRAIIITCDVFKSMTANSVDFVFSYTFYWLDFFIFGSINENNKKYFLSTWFFEIECRSNGKSEIFIKEFRL